MHLFSWIKGTFIGFFFIVPVILVQGFQKDPLFSKSNPLDLELVTQIKSLKSSTSDSVFFSTFLKYKNENGQMDSVPVDLRARGNSRRAQCFFPPIWIKIPNGKAKNTVFQGNRSLKLVLPCQEGEDFNTLIAKEYLAYQLFENLHEHYFETRLVNLTLTDQQSKKPKTYSLKAILVEDVDNVAKNFEAEAKNSGMVYPHQVLDTLALSQDFFAYMIGNTDWSNTTQHNVRMLDLDKSGYVPVPYDFDYSGLVNAPYAVPYDYLPIKSVTERLYRGICRDAGLTEWMRKSYLDREALVFGVLEANKDLFPNSDYKAIQNYLLGFYQILKDDKAYESKMIGTCVPYQTPSKTTQEEL